ncbi:hypothetical protein [Treponema sp.]|uniref:hypothetical protein n=1 Tax=Treponema sp. TaxID=166 RepID=UPI003FD6EB03
MNKKIYDPVFCNDEIKIWATSKQSFDKYLSKAKKCYNLLNTLDLNIKLSPINHIEIVRANIRFYLCSNVTEKVLDYGGGISIITKYGYSAVMIATSKKIMVKQNLSKEEMNKKIDKMPITKTLKARIKSEIDKVEETK